MGKMKRLRREKSIKKALRKQKAKLEASFVAQTTIMAAMFAVQINALQAAKYMRAGMVSQGIGCISDAIETVQKVNVNHDNKNKV